MVDMEHALKSNEGLKDEFLDEYGKWMSDSRTHRDKDKDYDVQQMIYSKYSEGYDALVKSPKHEKLAVKIESLYPTNKNITILDYCCGTGLVIDSLFERGFVNIDGYDGSQAMLETLATKNKTKRLFCGRNTIGLENITDGFYDVICSCASFFVSHSHPGTECFKDLCRIIKPGGFLIIIVKADYVKEPYVDMTVVNHLEDDGILRIKEEEHFKGYREKFEFEEDSAVMGIMYTYEVL